MKQLVALMLGLLLSLSLAAAELTNADVIKMIQAGLSDDVIIQTITSAQSPKFDTSADGLIALKKEGASDAVIQKIIAQQSNPAPQAATSPQPATSTPDCPLEAPEYGDTMVMRAGGQLIPMTYKIGKVETKAGGFLGNAFSFGIASVKSKTLLRIEKERASLRINDKQPQFLDICLPVGSSVDNVTVVRLIPKDDARYLQIGSGKANVAGASTTSLLFPEGIRVDMTAETVSNICIRDGHKVSIYRIHPTTPLENGEYALMASKSGSGMFFDFGVDK